MPRLCLAFLLVLGIALGIYDTSYRECVEHLLLLPTIDDGYNSWPNYHEHTTPTPPTSSFFDCIVENAKNQTFHQAEEICRNRFNYKPIFPSYNSDFFDCLVENAMDETFHQAEEICRNRFFRKPILTPNLKKLLESRRRRTKSIRISHQEQTVSSLGDLRTAHNSESNHSSINYDLLEFLHQLTKGMTWEQALSACTKRDSFNLGIINSGPLLSSINDRISEANRRLGEGLRIYHQQNVSSLSDLRSAHNSESIHFSDRDVHILGAKDSGPHRVERQITRQQQTASPRDNRRSAHVARKSESIHDAENSSPEDDPKYMRFERAMDGH